MVEIKTEQTTSNNFKKDLHLEQEAAKVISIDRDSLQKDLRGQTGSIPEIQVGGAALDPHTLKQMFLLGKITQGQLAHELKKYNDVVADVIIKEGKHSQVQSIDYREVGRASIANPGGDLKPNAEGTHAHQAAPKDAKSAKQAANKTDDPSKKREFEKKEEKLKNDQNLTQMRRLNNFNDAQIEQKNQHADREAKKIKEEKEIQHLLDDPRNSRLDKISKQAMNKAQIRQNIAAEIRAEIEKAQNGPMLGSQNKSKPGQTDKQLDNYQINELICKDEESPS
jgi:hypothetical protein